VLRLRPDQKAALGREAAEDFERRLVAHLRAYFEGCVTSTDDQLRATIQRLRVRAAGHGIVSERGVAMFVDVAFLVGEPFEGEPWAARILEAALSPDRRAERLLDAALASKRA
jgi:hypothetical protein